MQINRLSEKRIKKLSDGMHADGNGLYLKVRGGSRLWVFRYRWNYRRHELSIGSMDNIPLVAARASATELRAKIRTGINPAELSASRRVRKVSECPTFREMLLPAIRHRKEATKTRNPIFEYSRVHAVEVCLPKSFLDAPLSSFDPRTFGDIALGFWDKGQRPLCVTTVHQVFEYAKATGNYSGLTPRETSKTWQALLPKKLGATEHHTSMLWKDLPNFWIKLVSQPKSPTRDLLACTILCATRLSELANRTKDDIDLEAMVVVAPCTKTSDVPVEFPMPSQCADYLSFLGERIPKSNAWKYLRKLVPDATIHGFRASFSTWAGDNEKNPETREACLTHKIGNAVTAAYMRSNLLERRRRLLQEWADYVTSGTQAP